MTIRILAALLFLFLSSQSFAANHYILEGGAGDGSNWSSPWDDLPATLTRGDTYYIGDGTYAAYTFDDAASETDVITIKKATVADHGTDTGWSDAYGDGEAVFSSSGTTWTITTDYYVIDGQIGSGKSAGGYGIRVYSTASRASSATLVNVSGADNLSISHVEFDFNNGTSAGTTACTRMLGCWAASTDITLSECYFHHSSGYVFYLGTYGTPTHTQTNWIIEKCYFYMIGGGGSIASGHWELMWLLWANNFQFRYNILENVFEDIAGGANGQTGWLMVGGSTDVSFYGNLLFCSDSNYCDVGGNGIIATWSNDVYVNNGIYIYNNTFADITSRDYDPKIYFYHNTANDANVVCQNNLYFNSAWSWTGVDTQSHEACGGGQDCSGTNQQTGILSGQFTSYATDVFSLASATDAGTTLASPYDTDIQGATRGSDGTWDRGAYEYAGGGGGGDTTPPTPNPATFSSAPVATSSSQIDMTATEGVDDSGPISYSFAFTPCASNGGTGGTSSGWQSADRTYSDTALQPNKCYGYTITMRDASNNSGSSSASSEAYTLANVPLAPTFDTVGTTTVIFYNYTNGNPTSSPATKYAVQCVYTNPADASWLNKWVNNDEDGSAGPADAEVWTTDDWWDGVTITNLTAGTTYQFKSKARNNDQTETALGDAGQFTTTGSPPPPPPNPTTKATISKGSGGSFTAGTSGSITWE